MLSRVPKLVVKMGSCCVAKQKKKSPEHGGSQLRAVANPQWAPDMQGHSKPSDKRPIEPRVASELPAEDQELRRRQQAQAAEARLQSQDKHGFSKEGYIEYQYKRRAQDRVA
jgi:hypothetical protein